MVHTADYWIKNLGLETHPEGGYYKETYRSGVSMTFDGITGDRNVSTGIYFLLTSESFSAFHRIKSDEMWHFYAGAPIGIFVILPDGVMQQISLGLDLEKGETPQAVVPANCWFASRVMAPDDYTLVGCSVAPGFDFEDFEMANRETLSKDYPQHQKIITALTRE